MRQGNDYFIYGGICSIVLRDKNKNPIAYTHVDEEDAAWCIRYTWCLSANGYAVGTVGGKTVLLHRCLMGDKSNTYDHKSTDKLDNRKSNLRPCSRTQSSCNRNKNLLGTSKYKGVWKAGMKWRAAIQVNGDRIDLGRFISETAAAQAYNTAATILFGEFAKLNTI